MSLLEVNDLTMKFGGLTAVSKVCLKVEPGKIYSVIGPNGAGKTTVFNAITGIYEPTEGEVCCEGKRIARPLAWYVIASCLLIGLATGIGAALFMGNIDKLWRAAIRRNLYDEQRSFTFANAWREGVSYFRGDLGIERTPGGTYDVATFDGAFRFVNEPTRAQAETRRTDLAKLADALAGDPTAREKAVKPSGEQVSIVSPEDGHAILPPSSSESANQRLDVLAAMPQARAAHRNWMLISFLVGLVVGTAGAFTVWQRSRRTPDVISRGGLARTFQNIRLFQNMTVVENVLVGMDRKFIRNALANILRLPSAQREEAAHIQAAGKLLDFVGLKSQGNRLAKNLPYGDQRRLEIARALATDPKLLLLDEPAAGMNPAESDDLMHLVRKIRDRGITVVLIEHHMKLVMNISDHIAVLDHGEKIAEGTPAEVRANPKVVEAYLGKEEVS